MEDKPRKSRENRTPLLVDLLRKTPNQAFTDREVADRLGWDLTTVQTTVSHATRSNIPIRYWGPRGSKMLQWDSALAKSQQQASATPAVPALNLLITIPIGSTGTVDMTLEEARAVYNQLHALFNNQK